MTASSACLKTLRMALPLLLVACAMPPQGPGSSNSGGGPARSQPAPPSQSTQPSKPTPTPQPSTGSTTSPSSAGSPQKAGPATTMPGRDGRTGGTPAAPRCTGDDRIGVIDVDGNSVEINGRVARDGDLVCEGDLVTTDDSYADIRLDDEGYVHVDRNTDPRFRRQRDAGRCLLVQDFVKGQLQIKVAARGCMALAARDVSLLARSADQPSLINIRLAEPKVVALPPPPVRSPPVKVTPVPGAASRPSVGKIDRPPPAVTIQKPPQARVQPQPQPQPQMQVGAVMVTVLTGPPVMAFKPNLSISTIARMSPGQANREKIEEIRPQQNVSFTAGTSVSKVTFQRSQLPPELLWPQRSLKLAPKMMVVPR